MCICHRRFENIRRLVINYKKKRFFAHISNNNKLRVIYEHDHETKIVQEV